MTICIGALCENSKTIIAVTDMKVSFGGWTSADSAMAKTRVLAKNWIALYAGDAVQHVGFLLDRACELLKDKPDHSAAEVGYAVYNAVCEHRDRMAEALVLRPLGFTLKEFNLKGKNRMTDAVYESIHEEIKRVRIGVEFLLAGFEHGTGQLVYVSESDIPQSYSDIGYKAIGSGSVMALASLAFHHERAYFSQFGTVEAATYCACAAKFMSESGSDVGRETSVARLRFNQDPHLMNDLAIQSVRALWDSEGAPRVPDGARHEIAGNWTSAFNPDPATQPYPARPTGGPSPPRPSPELPEDSDES